MPSPRQEFVEAMRDADLFSRTCSVHGKLQLRETMRRAIRAFVDTECKWQPCPSMPYLDPDMNVNYHAACVKRLEEECGL